MYCRYAVSTCNADMSCRRVLPPCVPQVLIDSAGSFKYVLLRVTPDDGDDGDGGRRSQLLVCTADLS